MFGLLCWGFKRVQEEIHREEASTLQIGPVAFLPGQYTSPNSILVKDYLTTMGIKTVSQSPFCPDLAPCDFWLFPKPKGCHYETTEEMKEAVTKVIDLLTQEDFHGAIKKLLKLYKKWISAGRDYFERDKNFMCILLIKEPIQKKVWKIIVCTSYACMYVCMYLPTPPQVHHVKQGKFLSSVY